MIGDSVIKGRIFWCLLVLFMAIGNAGAQLATDCTLYVSPSGGGNGASPSAPTTLGGAQNASGPGDVICIMGGTYSLGSTFNVTNSGTSSAWIVYKAYGNSAVNVNWTGPSGPGNTMFRIGQQGTFPNGPHYLEFNGLNLDGKNLATNGFSCGGAHHLRFLNNTVKNTGGAGIATIECDYLTSDHNIIFHNGYAPCCGWTSAISYNSNQFLNTNAGLHSIISNNILAGEFDSSTNHTDGNGIILDLSCRSGCGTLATAHTPPVLIMNNVVYESGGRCISANAVSDFYVINNTCYKNGEDLTMNNPPGSFVTHESKTGYFVNNISYDWRNTTSSWGGHSVPSYSQQGSNSAISYYKNMWFIGGLNFTPSDPSQFFNQDPLFVGAPSVDPNLGDMEAKALSPSVLGLGLTLQPTSPAIHKGIDPSTIAGLDSAIASDLKRYVYSDIHGNSRAAGSWDLGAYQLSASATAPNPPSGLTATTN
ncbi:MAG: hypothetical protein DMG97_25430 [Acidobacteria bacterium]|nr:MAG: hypothetical protein DMG97_25430 [Acidobacteriota bacterium]